MTMALYISSAIVFVLILTFLTSYICYRLAFFVKKDKKKPNYALPDEEQYRPHKGAFSDMLAYVLTLPCEDVFITSRDGFRLHGKYYHMADRAPVRIMFHGYRSSPEKDFCGGVRLAVEAGHNVLLVDQRAHGQSEGRCLTFGILERFDCLSWTKYVVTRFGADTKIILCGMSMGAATVLMATALALPYNVVGVIADCGYSSPRGIIRKVLHDMQPSLLFMYPFLRMGGFLFGKFDIEAASAAQAMATCRIPVLFIHGEDDRFVPCDMGREDFELCAAKNKMLLIVSGAGHGLSFMVDEKACTAAIRDFLARLPL